MPAATPPPAQLPFFVYGTLRPGHRNHDALLLGRVATEEPATLDGAVLYAGPGYPYLVETHGSAGSARPLVHGDLVTPLPEHYDAVLRDLDILEHYAPGAPANLYARVAREAVRLDGTRVRAWVYVAAERLARSLVAGGTLVEGGNWGQSRGS